MVTAMLATFFNLEKFDLSLLTLQAPYEWGWRMHPMWGSGWGVGMMIMMALFWGAIIVAVILGMRWFVGQRNNSPVDSAMISSENGLPGEKSRRMSLKPRNED